MRGISVVYITVPMTSIASDCVGENPRFVDEGQGGDTDGDVANVFWYWRGH